MILNDTKKTHRFWVIIWFDRLRQAAIRSSETKRTVENSSEPERETTAVENKEKKDNFSSPKFDSFDQFKKYKQKMRDEGRTDQSLIVSIPNISGKFVSYMIISVANIIFRYLRISVSSVYRPLLPRYVGAPYLLTR